jgi:hypothetical protein
VNANLRRRWIKQFSATRTLAAIPTPLVPIQVELPPAHSDVGVIKSTIQFEATRPAALTEHRLQQNILRKKNSDQAFKP